MRRDIKFKDLTGLRFGRLLVLSEAGVNKHKQITWNVRCDCGVEKVALGCSLKTGHSKSCGCLQKELVRAPRTHGYCTGGKTDEYKIWLGIWQRCTNQKTKCYHHYGGRGITVCERWSKFENFLADVGPRPSKRHSIERKDGSLGYSPDNCKWATQSEQMNNTRCSVKITHNGETLTASQWADRLGVKRYTMYARLNGYGWSPEKALTTPVFNPK